MQQVQRNTIQRTIQYCMSRSLTKDMALCWFCGVYSWIHSTSLVWQIPPQRVFIMPHGLRCTFPSLRDHPCLHLCASLTRHISDPARRLCDLHSRFTIRLLMPCGALTRFPKWPSASSPPSTAAGFSHASQPFFFLSRSI